MSTMKIKKGDMVKVIAGKDKDKEGKVIAVDKKDVMYVHKGKATRVGFKMDGDKKVRVAKSTGEVID